MSVETFEARAGFLERLIIAAGRRRIPDGIAGKLALTLPSGRKFAFGSAERGISAELNILSYKAVWAAVRRGALGFCEAYVHGHWDSPDPANVFLFYLQNREPLDRASSAVFFQSLLDHIWHRLRANSRAGSRRNIEAHYDLGNDFYRLWLDEGMTYSSAWFGGGAQSLEEAQAAKYKFILEALDLDPAHHLLEIGCGWGGLAEAAVELGADVTGITLSNEQLDFAQARLGDGADLRLEDYRDTQGTFDRIASVEMIEAVGEAHWPRYFQTLAERLKPGGAAVIQAITIDERWFPAYRRSADFIQRYIFPGGMLPTKEIIKQQALAAGLSFEPLLSFGLDYARTLTLWRERFEAAWPKIAELGFDEGFRRKWRLYLDYCEAGFRDRTIDVGIYRFSKLR